MKLKLDEKEMANIIKDWAKRKYNTHNINLEYGIDLDGNKFRSIYAEVEIILSDDQFTDASSAITAQALAKVRGNIKHEFDVEPDNTPQWNDNGTPL